MHYSFNKLSTQIKWNLNKNVEFSTLESSFDWQDLVIEVGLNGILRKRKNFFGKDTREKGGKSCLNNLHQKYLEKRQVR